MPEFAGWWLLTKSLLEALRQKKCCSILCFTNYDNQWYMNCRNADLADSKDVSDDQKPKKPGTLNGMKFSDETQYTAIYYRGRGVTWGYKSLLLFHCAWYDTEHRWFQIMALYNFVRCSGKQWRGHSRTWNNNWSIDNVWPELELVQSILCLPCHFNW